MVLAITLFLSGTFFKESRNLYPRHGHGSFRGLVRIEMAVVLSRVSDVREADMVGEEERVTLAKDTTEAGEDGVALIGIGVNRFSRLENQNF